MESLESKLERLNPGQRKEAEDFVDFLLTRQEQAGTPSDTPDNLPPVMNVAPPPFIPIEPEPGGERQDIGSAVPTGTTDRTAAPAGTGPSPVPFREVGGGTPDRLTHDYMDYGQFEHPPSPATEAVKKVKRKIIARDAQEKPRHLLDWVD